MFIINPDSYLLPAYRISPFRTEDISNNNKLSYKHSIDDYFKDRFQQENFSYFSNGRAAINEALTNYELHIDDVVSILTTSGNLYISGCVTAEIEKFCKWDRKVSEKTKVIFVNHEFGYPYHNLSALKEYGLPIIEDCAHSFYSKDKYNNIGTVGDFVIYSFPKMFPIQIGALLVSNVQTENRDHLDKETLQYIKKVLSHYITQKDAIIKRRIENYKKLKKELADFGFTERFELKEGIVPGVYLFNVNNKNIDLDKLKIYLWKHGIQCSVFYGERAFFIPVHQNLEEEDILYFKTVIEFYLKELK